MPPPTSLPTVTGGNISSTPFVQPFSTPSTGLRTRELHGPGYYHVGSPADPGYAEHMRAMFGRDEVDPPRRNPPTSGSSSQGTCSQSTQRTAWQARPGHGIPALPGNRIIPTRAIDSRDTAYRRTLHFGMTKVPKLTRATLVNTEVHLFIQYIHRLLSHEAFVDSVLGNMIDTETISLLQFIFYST
jgi:hypothetical protein